jgi:hypothetical protein
MAAFSTNDGTDGIAQAARALAVSLLQMIDSGAE